MTAMGSNRQVRIVVGPTAARARDPDMGPPDGLRASLDVGRRLVAVLRATAQVDVPYTPESADVLSMLAGVSQRGAVQKTLPSRRGRPMEI